MTVVSEVLALDEGSVHVLRAEGVDSPLVLLHGAGGNTETWREAAPQARSWIAVDLPGRGGSDRPALRDVEAMARWLLAVLGGLSLESPVIVGHSMGGAIGLSLALLAPSRLSGLVLVSSSARLRVAPAILQAVEQAGDDDPLSYGFAFGPECPTGVRERYDAAAHRTPQATSVADWHACNGFDVRERVGILSILTLVVYGERDALTPAKHQRWLAEAAPRAELVSIPGAGHMLPWEAPKPLWSAVDAWLSVR